MDQIEKDSLSFLNRMAQVMKQSTGSVLADQPKCHFPILHRLAVAIETCGRNGCINVSDLANSLYNSPQAVSRCLRILEQDGLVERLTDPADRRKTMVRLTPEGQAAHDACADAMHRFSAAVMERMGPERLQRMQQDWDALLAAMENTTNRSKS